MSSKINILLAKRRQVSKKQRETTMFIKNFVSQNKREPTLREIADNFKISVPSVWERLRRIERNGNCCHACGREI